MPIKCELRVWEGFDSTPASLVCRDMLKAIRIAGSLARTGEFHRVLLTEERGGMVGSVVRFSFERGTAGVLPGEYVPAMHKGG